MQFKPVKPPAAAAVNTTITKGALSAAKIEPDPIDFSLSFTSKKGKGVNPFAAFAKPVATSDEEDEHEEEDEDVVRDSEDIVLEEKEESESVDDVFKKTFGRKS